MSILLFLLELPRAALKFSRDKEEETEGITIIEEDEGIETKVTLTPPEKVNQIDASCFYCHSIFLGESPR